MTMKCDHEIDDLVPCDEQATRFFVEKGRTIVRGPYGRLSMGDCFHVIGFCSRHIPYAIRPSDGPFMDGLQEILIEEVAIWEVQDS